MLPNFEYFKSNQQKLLTASIFLMLLQYKSCIKTVSSVDDFNTTST